MHRTIGLTITTLALLAATAATAQAQLRVQMRTTPQIRVMTSPTNTHFNPKQITISKPVGATGTHFNPKEIAVTNPVPWPSSKPKEIVVVGSRSAAKGSTRANDRLRNAGPPDGWSR